MANSNHTSFATADQEYFPSLMSTSLEKYEQQLHSESPYLSYQRNRSFESSNDERFSDPALIRNLQKNKIKNEALPDFGQQQLSPSSSSKRSISSSESIESGHTIINNVSEVTFGSNEKKTNEISNNLESAPLHHHDASRFADLIHASEPKTYPIAWLLLFFVVLLRSASAIFSYTFSPIPSVTAEFLGVSLSKINWLYTVMSIVYIVTCFFTSWLYEVVGVKYSLLISGIVLSLGCWVRWIAAKINPPSFPVLMIGQTIASISSPICLNIMTTFAALWFTENRRATAGMFIVSNYGGIVAMFLMPAIATGLDRIEFTLILVSIIATACTIPFLFFPKKPLTPSSYVLIEDLDSGPLLPKINLRQGTVLLLKNPHFLTLCVIHGINIALFNSWSGLMNQAITPYGYSDSQVGNIAAVGVIGGTLGCLIAGPTLDKTKQHKILLKIMAPLMLSTYVAFIFVIKEDSFASILYANFMNQFFLNFIVPICVELGVEVSYPIPESLSTSILWQLSQVISVTFVLVMDLFRDPNGVPKNNMYKGLVFQAAMAGICILFVFIFNGPMLRMEAFKKQEESRKRNNLNHHSGSSNTLQTLRNESEAAVAIKTS